MPDFWHVGVKEGLDNGFVLDLAIDRQGFVWAATEAGVCRISGTFITEFNKTNSAIGSNETACLYYYPKANQVWIGSKRSGISIYDCDGGEFYRLTTGDGLLSNDIVDITSSSDGGVWILHRNKGLQHYDSASKQFRNITVSDFPQFSHQARACADDGLGHLYIGHFGGGLSVIDLSKRRLTRYVHGPAATSSLPSDYIRTILVDSRQNVWIGTNGGAALFNPQSETIRPLDNKYMAGENIFDITETSDGRIWFASDLGGVSILKRTHGYSGNAGETAMERLTVDNSGLSSPNVRCIREDSFGNVWIAHYSTGLDFLPAKPKPFGIVDFRQPDGHYQRIYGLAADKDGRLWMGGENILALYRNGKVERTFSIGHSDDRKGSIVYAIHPDRHGRLWLGINDVGVMVFNPAANEFAPIDLGGPLDVHAFWEDSDGTIFIGTEKFLYSYKNGKVSAEKAISDKLRSPAIYALHRDTKGRLWVGMLSKGLALFDREYRLVVRIGEANGLPSNSINQIFEDRQGSIWVATYDGLVRFGNLEDLSRFDVFDSKNGLTDSHVRAIAEDRNGNIWVTTFKGVSCLKKGEKAFSNYDYTDGLPEGGFVESSMVMTPDGMIFLGSPNGVGCFNPFDVNEAKAISGLQIVTAVALDGNGGERRLALGGDTLTVPYGGNTLRINFTVADYSETRRVEYSYMLDGSDKDWQFLGAENSVTLRNLSAGTYVLKLRVRMKNGKWNDDGIYTKTIVVMPPVWLLWYFKLLYAVILIAVIVWIVRRRNNVSGRKVEAGPCRQTQYAVEETSQEARHVDETVSEEAAAGDGDEQKLSRADREFLAKLSALIEENLTSNKLDMAFLTDKMNMSHSTFYRKLKALTGLTVVDYVRKIKLRRSLELISSGETSITEIAYKAGFNSPGHFREAFKDEYGMSPSQYIKENKRDNDC